MVAKIAKVIDVHYISDYEVHAVFLTDKGIIVKSYNYDEQFFKEVEKGFVKYENVEEFI